MGGHVLKSGCRTTRKYLRMLIIWELDPALRSPHIHGLFLSYKTLVRKFNQGWLKISVDDVTNGRQHE